MPYSSIDDLPEATQIAKQSVVEKAIDFLSELAGLEKHEHKVEISESNSDWQTEFDITKTDSDQQLAFGWLSVSETPDGELIIDKQGDIIEPEELEKAAYNFTLDARKAGDMHKRTEGIGRLVESMVFTKQKQEALGIPEGCLPIGWFVGFKVDDKNVWKKIKSGEYNAFSIGGKGIREKVE